MDEENNRWIETGLAASFERLDLRAAPAQARYTQTTPRWRRKRMSLLAGIPAILTTKVAAAAAIALTAAGGAVAAKGAVTGDPNPLSWGSTVTQQVQACKAALPAGQHGIGSCVSSTANQHGQQQRQGDGAVVPAHPTGPPVSSPAHPSGRPSAHPTGPADSHPSTPAITHPSGAPSDHPTSSNHPGPAIHA